MRQLTTTDVKLLNRPSAFDEGHTLVHLAIRWVLWWAYVGAPRNMVGIMVGHTLVLRAIRLVLWQVTHWYTLQYGGYYGGSPIGGIMLGHTLLHLSIRWILWWVTNSGYYVGSHIGGIMVGHTLLQLPIRWLLWWGSASKCYSLGRRDFFFRACCTSFHTHSLFLPPLSVSLSYFILAVPMPECLGKHSCMSFTFPIAILNGNCFFRQCNCTMKIRCDIVEIRMRQ